MITILCIFLALFVLVVVVAVQYLPLILILLVVIWAVKLIVDSCNGGRRRRR